MAEAQALADRWRWEYNTLRLHSALQGGTPLEAAQAVLHNHPLSFRLDQWGVMSGHVRCIPRMPLLERLWLCNSFEVCSTRQSSSAPVLKHALWLAASQAHGSADLTSSHERLHSAFSPLQLRAAGTTAASARQALADLQVMAEGQDRRPFEPSPEELIRQDRSR